jgi:protoporphyrinogen oxidase
MSVGRGRAVIIGAGFCGLTAAHELAKRGFKVTVLEKDSEIGGLAGSFLANGTRLEKFYHHWFTSDQHIVSLIDELGTRDQVLLRPTRTGMYYANNIFRLSSPLDVLRFKSLSVFDRFRLGVLVIRAKQVKEWRELEGVSASEWLRKLAGPNVYRVIWEPLLRGKFGEYADAVSAVWFWNKLKLRGGSRNKGGGEQLAYYKGGFAALADQLAARITSNGGIVRTNSQVTKLLVSEGKCAGVAVGNEIVPADIVIATPPLPLLADLLAHHLPQDYVSGLRRIKYLANLCIVLELDRSLSSIYWLNVNDPEFPFVGVIEHTNFEPPQTYGNRHIVYLSKYLPETEQYFRMSDEEVLEFSLPHLKRMFPAFSREWILNHHVWRAHYSQPLVELHYSRLIPPYETPLPGLYLASMAQIYPEDRGTNYAVREGQKVAALAADKYEPQSVVRRLAS